jgi:PAS domain S-box-containing protein
MISPEDITEELLKENRVLRARLEEAEELLTAIRGGSVDALLVEGPEGAQVYTLQGADQTYRVFVETMNEGAATIGPDGTIAYCNRRFAELIGVPLEQTVGRSLAEFVSESHGSRIIELLRQVNTGNSETEVELGPNGRAGVPARLSVRPMPLVDGEFVCLVATDLRSEKLREKLTEQDRRKDEFLAMLGHELRNPLAIIHNLIQVLRQKSADPPTVEMRAMIEEQTVHMARLLDDLLDVARLNTGKIRLEKSRVELSTLISATAQAFSKDFSDGGISLDLDLPPTPIYLNADRTRLAQVFGNVLNNANKFTDRGGTVTLTLSADPKSSTAIVTVRDSGIGMDSETLQRLFESFSQADRSIDRTRGGLGLGLALVRGLVELHEGTVTAFSEGLDQGTTITIRLPFQTDAVAPASQFDPRRIAEKRRALRVLIIDDNHNGALSTQMLVQMLGHVTEVAYDGAAALEKVAQFKPEVVFCDIGLPKMDGYEVARQLRRRSDCRDRFLIALSGYGMEDDKRRSLEAGFDVHVVKPVHPNKLQEILAAVK